MFQKVQLVLLLSAVGTLAQLCPPAEDLTPCTCDEAKLAIECAGIRGRFDIKGVFDRVSPMVDDSVIFNRLDIFETGLLEIPAGSVESLKFKKIFIDFNQNLEYISPEAFNATTAVTTELSLWNNYISNAPPYESDFFDFLNKFTVLEKSWSPANRIQSVPDLAFEPSTTVTELYLGSNPIATMGSKVFSQLPNLKKVYMAFTSLNADSFKPDTFEGVSNQLDIELESNDVKYLPESIFKPLLDNALHVAVGGSYCGHTGCTYDYLDCNEEAHWLCQNVTLYQPKLSGFRCTDFVYPTVWEYCADKFGNVTSNFL